MAADRSGIRIDELPPLLREVAEMTSVEVALTIARRFGGRRHYVPVDIPDRHPLVQLLGRQIATVIAARLGGDYVTWTSAQPLLRKAEAIRLRRAGWSLFRIAERIRTSPRHVARLVAGVKKGSGAVAAACGTGHGAEVCPVCGTRKRHKTARPPSGQLRLPGL